MATLIPMPAGSTGPMPASRLGALEAARQAALLRMPDRPAGGVPPAALPTQHQARRGDGVA